MFNLISLAHFALFLPQGKYLLANQMAAAGAFLPFVLHYHMPKVNTQELQAHFSISHHLP